MITINSLMEYVEPEYRMVLRDMLNQKGNSGETPIDDIDKLFPPEGLSLDQKIMLACLKNANKGKFAPKLDFTKRCEILALHRIGFTNEILSHVYGVDRRTITHIFNGNSPHYKPVREHEIGLGRETFITKYVTDPVLSAAEAFRSRNVGMANPNAKRKAGVHQVRNSYCNYTHRVVIQWLEASQAYGEAGWFYRDMDGDEPDKWFIAGADRKNTLTSQACFMALQEEIMDSQRVLDSPPAT